MIAYVFLILVPILSTTKVTIQGKLSRILVSDTRDAFLMNAVVFALSALWLASIYARSLPSAGTVLWALAFAVSNIAFQTVYLFAFKIGSVSLTSTICNFNALLPILMNILIYDGSFGLFTVIGMVAMAIALILIPRRDETDNKKFSFKWLLLALLSLFFSGFNNCLITALSHQSFGDEKNLFTVVSYLFSALFCFIGSLVIPKKEESRGSFRLTPLRFLGLLGIALSLGTYMVVLMKTLTWLSPSVVYSVANVTFIFLITVIDLILFREKLTKRQLVGIFFGAVAAVGFCL